MGSWDSHVRTAAAAKSLQFCPTLCDPIDGSPPGSTIPGVLQARTLEWAAISFSNAWKWKVKSLSRIRLLATPWTAAYQAPLSMGFSRQEDWSGVPLPSSSMYALLYLKWITRTCCRAQANLLSAMWQPGWEGSLGENRYMYVYGWVPLLFIWNYHKLVCQSAIPQDYPGSLSL